MSRRRQRLQGRREGGLFGSWPHQCAAHPNYARLSLSARALLLELIGQFNGMNNGDLSCAYGILQPRGWKSRTTIEKARLELETLGWIVLTRRGGRNRCSLYALTFYAIDECRGKLDVQATKTPLGFWNRGTNPWLERVRVQRPPANSFALPKSWAVRTPMPGQVAQKGG